MRNTITEMKNTLEGTNRLSDSGEWISELKDKVVENVKNVKEKQKLIKRNEDSLSDL